MTCCFEHFTLTFVVGFLDNIFGPESLNANDRVVGINFIRFHGLNDVSFGREIVENNERVVVIDDDVISLLFPVLSSLVNSLFSFKSNAERIVFLCLKRKIE